MRYVQCKNCKKVYPGSLKKCPDCEAKTPPSTARIVIGIIIAIFGVVLLVYSAVNFSEEPKENSGTTSSTSVESEEVRPSGKVTYENFAKIENGMTYEQVVEILGEEGKVLSEVDVGMDEYATAMYYWYDDTGIANCNVTFQGGKVIAKAQVGLN